MNIIDMHCDTMHKIFRSSKKNLYENKYSVDIKKMLQANSIAQFFALFLNMELINKHNKNIYEYTLEFYKVFHSIIKENSKYINFAHNYNDFNANRNNNKISAFLTIEEGGFLENKIERIDEFHRLGVRLITLTWNYENCIGFPNSNSYNIMNKGLKPFGFEVVEKMNKLGIIVDVSHLSDGGFFDVVNHSTKPIVASHSNARALRNVPRNMSDDMIRLLSLKGGVIGINFCPHFLGNSNICKISDLVKQIKYIKNIGGIECLALGTDFDGIEGELEIENIGEINKLLNRLKEHGLTYDEIEKICYKNVERIIRECLN
ncbi:MAG: dipeptidase [Eubacteriaceae bacterium]